MDSKRTEVYSRQHTSQRDTCQSSNHLGKRERHDQAYRSFNHAGKPSALATNGSTSQSVGSTIRISSQVLGAGGRNEVQCPSRQAQDHIYRETVRPKFQDENETSHRWAFGAVAELLDNVVDEIPHGATKVLIDSVTNLCDGSPSLLVQDDGGGMDPISLWKCMTDACPNRKTPDSIGQNGTGFRAGISYLGTSAIVFSRHVHTSTPTQSIGMYVAHNAHLANQIEIPMVHYDYNPVTGETIGYEHKPGQFSINMSMMLRLSPYNSEEELLQNLNDIGPHGTKIIVFNLSRNTEGHLDLDFDTDTKDIRISVPPTMHVENEAAGDQSNLVYQYRRSLRAYVSILYLDLPKHFRIILRGEEVKRRNLVTELKHSQCIKYRRSMAERDDEVVLGFLDGVADVGDDRFCFYYKQRLIVPFVPPYRFSNRDRSIVGVVQANYLKPARNKQDFLWSSELKALLKILKDTTTKFWKHLKGKELKDAASWLSLAPPVSHNEANLKGSNITWMHSQITPSVQAHSAGLIFKPIFSGMPVPRAPTPCLPLFPTASTRDKQQMLTAIVTSSDQGTTSNGIPTCHTTLPFGWNSGGLSSHGIQRAPAPRPLTSDMASLAGDRRLIIPVAARSNDYGINFKGGSTPIAPRAFRASGFIHPNRGGMGSNGIMRAPAPHLAACYMPATAGERRRSTLATQDTMVNTIGGLAPSHSGPSRAMVALHDLPIEIKPENDDPLTYGNNAIRLGVGVTDTAIAVSAASSATSIREPDVMGIGDRKASAFYPWCPPGFKPDNGAPSSSRQAQELQDGINQEEQGTKPLLNIFKP